MKNTRFLVHHAFVIVIAACLSIPRSGVSAEKIWTTNSTDRAACQRQLNLIFGALQEYQKRNHKLPRWLSDLVPEFIHDPDMLVCPFVMKTGNLKKWREMYVTVPVFGDPATCTYAYEFCLEAFRYVPGWTTRDYKQRQMEVIGLGVPIVRCFAHRPVLNLAFDGSIYASQGEWEDNFVTSPASRAAFHDVPLLTNRSENAIILQLIEPRKSRTDPRMLDLSKQYNALLLHLSQLDHSGKLLAGYPEGLQRIGGVECDVRGLIHLAGKDFPIPFPEKIEKIGIGRKCAQIHFLHGTMFSARQGSKIASYIVHYRDGRTNEISIVYGIDVKTQWFDRNRESALQNPKVAWLSPSDRAGTTGKSLRLYLTSWKNQDPDAELESIDFVSHMTESAPFLLAITTE